MMLLWIFHSTLNFPPGTEFTRARTHVYIPRCDDPASAPRTVPLKER